MNRNIINLTLLLLYAVLLGACQNATTTTTTEHAQEHGGEHEANTNVAVLSAEQMKAIDLQMGSIEQKQLTTALKLSGVLKVPNENKAQVTAMYSGLIKTINVQVGNHVKKGQTIATISSPQLLQLQEEYLQAKLQADGTQDAISVINQPQYAGIKAQLETLIPQIAMAENEVKRQRILNEGNAGVMKKLQEAETQLNTLLAQKRTLEQQKTLFAGNTNSAVSLRKANLERQLQLMGVNPNKISAGNIQNSIAIVSPLNGVISKIMPNIGSNVDMLTPIAEVVDNNELHLDLFVFEKDLPKVKVGQKIHFVLTNNAQEEYDAEIFGIGGSFESNTKNVAVHAHVEGNKEGLIDGMNITAIVSLDKATRDAVPTQAIVNHEGQDYILMVANNKAAAAEHGHDHAAAAPAAAEHGHDHETANKGALSFEKVPVRKGTSDVGYSEIILLKEIPKDARIVTKGAFFVLAAMTNQGEGHEH
jgi:cobalt-zinc-cadmium efflux system membrane fusion protein